MTVGQHVFLGAALTICLVAPSSAQEPSESWQSDVARSLAPNVPDGFSVATVGDIQLTRPISRLRDRGLQSALKWVKDASVAVGNLETTLIDPAHFEGYPFETNDSLRPIGAPAVAKDLADMGFDIVSRANNHATDWSIAGMLATDRLLDSAGIVHAGTGANRAAARAAAYLDTPDGRIGFLSITSTFEQGESALPPLGRVPGRAGANTLRNTRVVLVDHEAMLALRRVLAAQPPGSADFDTSGNRLSLFGVAYQESDHFGFTYDVNQTDRDEFLRSIREGKLNSDFLILNIHSHEPGNWSDPPADFISTLAHAAVDAGVDVVMAEGPHHLRGIEVYKGRPIFYSLGNFAIQFAPQEPVAEDMYEKLEGDPNTLTDAELIQSRIGVHVEREPWYQSVVAVSTFAKGTVSKIELHPITLALNARMADRGLPHAATGPAARKILDSLATLSQQYRTHIDIEGDVGVIRVAP
jgi:poly-gamma-glutamate capsule biosynthesis protein CapA/YwtB (metallophosphatase superfamily)